MIYYWFILPNGRRVKSSLYETVDLSDDFPYIHIPGKPDPYRILTQTEDGDYVFLELDSAPDSAYSGNDFTKPYYQAREGEYIVSNR